MPPLRAYLDHNATTPLRAEARAAMGAVWDLPGNASSIHAEGRAAHAMIEAARAELAAFVNAPAGNVIFTSGGTEALNLALTPHLEAGGAAAPFDLLLAGGGEHAAVLAGHRFPAAAFEAVGLTPAGALDLDALDAALARHRGRRPMLALQAANNETGVIQPVAAAAERVHAAGGFLVCDAVQAAGKIPCDMQAWGADALIVSAHKFGGPQGAGGLCFASPASHIRQALIRGGGQEHGLRAGTENVAGIAGMAAALRAAAAGLDQEAAKLAAWRDRLEADISRIAPGAVFFGAGVARLPNTSCFALPGVEAQVLLMFLDVEGVAVSSGSACSSGKVKRSHVLAAMGIEQNLAGGAIRVSMGWNSRAEDCVLFGRALERAVHRIGTRKVKSAGQAAA
ncbi:cysteine desulfurase family protein [Methylocapsa aurea]|uniref:cysteine desulfurase family protein n=1 Tax=Methylocapsa aurea TaxID=663610 RepID=UPI00055AEE47|nr:cysteine desulfurase family protein [Methylocapsa aurea]